MANETFYMTMKFGGSSKNFINHLFLGDAPADIAVAAAVTDLELLTRENEGDTVLASGARVVSVTRTIQRILANQDTLEVQDLAAVNPHVITGRLLRLDDTVTPNKTFTQPFIMRGVNPNATAPPLFSVAAGSNYITWLKEFLIKYARVNDVVPTGVAIVRDSLQH